MTPEQAKREVIKRCQTSVAWFLRNFGKIKHPSAGIIPFHPFNYQLKALKDFRKHRLNIFRKCFVKGSMVWTPSGPKPIEMIAVGEQVYTYNEKAGAVETSPVKAAVYNGEKETVIVRTKTGHRSVCTPNHRFLTRRGWVEAKDLTTNDILVEIHEPARYIAANHSEAIMLGYLITDGYYGRSHGCQFNFTNTRWKYLLEFQKHFELKFFKRLRIRVHAKPGEYKSKLRSYRITSSGNPACDWLKSLGIWGHKSRQKCLPECVFSWDNASIAVLLNRLFAGDGWYSGSHCNEVGIGSESELLLHQIKQLLSRFQIDAKYYPAKAPNLAKLRIFGTDHFSRFVDQIGIVGKDVRHQPSTKGFFRKRIKGQVKSVKPGGILPVYDLEVEPHHNFIVDGATVHNCRQAGVSKISGAFALWFAMFNSHKTILIVSRRNEDAMSFLREHIYFLFNNLPVWMKELWAPIKQNEHEVFFPNGSKIQSLTSHPEVLRSHAASLNIIDEAAFVPNMDTLWAAGWPTLQHGGSVICISTTNGVGNWYWSTWTDAEAGISPFHPIVINWWDMDWVIEYTDALSLEKKRLAPRDNIRDCVSRHEKEKFGPYWSPWLEEQWNALQEQGEGWKFEQEVLASFIGSGNTVLDKTALAHVLETIRPPEQKIDGVQPYVHPSTNNVEELNFSFIDPDQGFWIWKKPVLPMPERRRGNVILDQATPAHRYVMGVDIATGKGRDYSTLEIFDLDTREQVAEFMARVLPRELIKFIDRLGRYYNNALAVIERNNGGDIVIDALRHDCMYPRLWRRKDINDKPQAPTGRKRKMRALKVSPYGYATTSSSKPTINKFLIDYIRDDGTGYRIYSQRLLKQLQTYVRKRDKAGRDTMKTEAEDGAGNFDDLVIATGLAFVGTSDAYLDDNGPITPVNHNSDFRAMLGPTILTDEQRVTDQKSFLDRGGSNLLMPMTMDPIDLPEVAAQRVLDAFTYQLGAIPSVGGKPLVTPPKYFKNRKKD